MKALIVALLAAVLASPALCGESEKPSPGKDDPARPVDEKTARPAVELHIDADGAVRVLPAEMAGKASPDEEILELKPAGMKAALGAMIKACASAPRVSVKIPEKPTADEPKQKIPARILLRWNPTIGKCKVYIGQVLCNYDDQGLARAGSKLKALVEAGTDSVNLDIGADVPMKTALAAISMTRESGIAVEKTLFSGRMDPLGDEAQKALEGLDRKTFWSDKDGVRSFPSVDLRIRVSPDAQWRFVQFLLQECAHYGINELAIGSKPDEKTLIRFPVDAWGASEESGIFEKD